MPYFEDNKSCRTWWQSRTGLEQKLLILSTLLFIVAFSLMITVIVLKNKSSGHTDVTTQSPTVSPSPVTGSTPTGETPVTSPASESSNTASEATSPASEASSPSSEASNTASEATSPASEASSPSSEASNTASEASSVTGDASASSTDPTATSTTPSVEKSVEKNLSANARLAMFVPRYIAKINEEALGA